MSSSDSSSEKAVETSDPTPIPEWLNERFLIKHLQNNFPECKIFINNFQVKLATAKGDNFNSVIYRVNIEFTDEPNDEHLYAQPVSLDSFYADLRKAIHNFTYHQQHPRNISVIVKAPLPDGLAYETLLTFNSYGKELEFYGTIVPKIQSILSEINEFERAVPRVYGVCDANLVILLEDMASLGYKVEPVQRGFNLEEAKTILKKCAALNAACAILQQRQPNIYKNFQTGLMTRTNDRNNIFYESLFDVLIEVVSSWPDFSQYTEKMKRMRSKLIEKGRAAFDADPSHFNTLIQDDLWTNNILVKNSEEMPIENLVLIDWAHSCWTSPAIDIQHFFHTSLHESLRPGKFDELIADYHSNLAKNLTRLCYRKEIPSLTDFRRQFDDKVFYGFIAACLIQPVLTNTEHTENADYEALVMADERAMEYKRLLYKSPRIQAILRKFIPYFDQFGVFD